MKRLTIVLMLLAIAAVIIVGGCNKAATTTTTTSTTSTAPPPAPTSTSQTTSQAPTTTQVVATSTIRPPTSSTTTTTSTTTKPSTTTSSTLPVTAGPPPSTTETPIYGGTLRIIATAGPANVGYAPEQAFSDHTPGPLWSERLMWLGTNGDLIPALAESWQTAPDGLSITLKLRKGVKFHDGTDFNAQAVKWGMDLCKQAGTLPGAANFTTIEVVDDLTVKFNMKEKNILAAYNIARPYIYSPTAAQKNGKEWAATHAVSTAPFIMESFQRDVEIKLVKNPNYWRPNRPYLDAISFKIVKEPAAAAAMMKAGQADIWMQGTAQEGADLRDSGFTVLTGPNVINNIYGDSANPNSPFAKKAVREAVEYAMDRPAIAKALGFGFQTPINQMTPPGTAGYNPNYVGRPYDPVKAKLLLGGAGYPEGFKTTLTCQPTAVNLATVVKNYLAVIGIDATIDIADPGRYWGMINGGWQGMMLGVSALNPEYAVVFLDHFGPYPAMKFAGMAKTPEFLAECQKIYSQPDVASMRKQTQKMVTQASEDAMAIPLTYQLMNTPIQKWVRTTFHTAIDWTGWYIFDDWMTKH